ncbi:MAG: DUF4446 family protein [Candidatus Nanopelagicales bacterium]|nr:DUF4446 family protein [Candidatus Nanopelagicales bacterium]MDZ4248920.1 DUF4446 family protein [Candidatus Nanopelagicales bacterium]MDZ7576890.1 DUF4446 family protein [Candidatus Nanopelagicales bacterium]
MWAALTLVVAIIALVAALVALRRVDVVAARAGRSSDGPLQRDVDSAPSGGTVLASSAAPESVGLSRLAVVRYDAFDDLGGQLSYSAALLDDAGKGIVITGIHGRSETRTYLKQVPTSGSGAVSKLSPEEQEAVRDAMRGSGHA